MSKKSKGFPEFERVYREIYGDRWPRLLDALRMEAPKFALENPFFKQNQDVKQVYELDFGLGPCGKTAANSAGSPGLGHVCRSGGEVTGTDF